MIKIIKLISCLIPFREKRHHFRNKYALKFLPKASGELRILQNALYFMLENLKEICEKNKIPYWIQAGTLLGAYRHQGWIPWDDDLDVGMLEVDLRKLKQVMKNHPVFRIDDYYHFKDHYVGRFTRMKFRDERFNCFLDIPVYEYCDEKNIDDAWNKILDIRQNFIQKAVLLSNKLTKVYDNEIITNLEDLKIVEDFYNIEIDKVHKTNGKYIYWATYCVPAKWKRCFPKQIFFPLKKLKFEDKFYSVPNCFKEYLSLQYGDVSKTPCDIKPRHVKDFELFKNIELLPVYINGLKEKNNG
jgi:lipopolysaccharide cholinephosphotransferase